MKSTENRIGKKIRVLIVEDVEPMRALLEYAVREIPGYAVSETVKNSLECRLSLAKRRPDLILLDEVLPGESGLDLLSEIKALELPVILLTGLEMRKEPLPEGALGRLYKPAWDTLKVDKKRMKVAMDQALKLFRVD